MKNFFRGALAAGLLAIAGQAHGICTPNATGLQLDIPNFGDNFATWATCIQDDLQIINDSAASTSTLTIATTTLQAQIDLLGISTGSLQLEVDALGVSTGSLQLEVDALGVSTGALELSKVDRAGDAMTGSLTMLSSTITVGGSEFSVGLSTLVVTGGQVGVGTTAPAGKLHVVSDSSIIPLFLDSFNVGSITRIRRANGDLGAETVVSNGNFIGNLQFLGYDGAAYVRGADISIMVDGNPASGDVPMKIMFRTAPQSGSVTGRMVINSTGNVGIGTADPEVPLHVVGNASFTGTAFAGSMKVNDLINCDTIDTDGTGAMVCGIDGGVGFAGLADTQTFSGINTYTNYTVFETTFTRAINTDTSFVAALYDPPTTEDAACIANSTATIKIKGSCVVVEGMGSFSYNQTGFNYGISYLINGDFPVATWTAEREKGVLFWNAPNAGYIAHFHWTKTHCGYSPGTVNYCVIASFEGGGLIGPTSGSHIGVRAEFRITEY